MNVIKLSIFLIIFTNNIFSHNYTVTNNCVTLNAHVGLNGWASTNLDYSLCSFNGTDFGFIPLQSALDYQNGSSTPLSHDIESENISSKLSKTPFDVIIGYTDGVNGSHLSYRDEKIFNLTGQPAITCQFSSIQKGKYIYYDADLNGMCDIDRSILCLEIGDEEMYLENWNLNRPARLSAQYDMYVNETFQNFVFELKNSHLF